jgi:propane monooxygenase large subunit
MSRQSLTKAHQKIQELSWEPTFATPAKKYATDYTFEKAPKKDPLKQVLRSYFPMEEEKDNRVFGAMDGAIRGNMFRQVQERWMEWQKLFLSIIPFPEISAARAMPLSIGAVPNPEIHNGLAVQMIDEVRHSTIQMNLKKLYMNNYIDPAGFDITEKAFANNYAGTIGRQFGEGFITGDAITAANIYLTIVAETAFTNTLFVAMPSEAAANGDYLLPTVFHSVQSDESRHISNGYSILLMALADERNRELLERDLRYAWWNNHAVVDAAIGTFIEYGSKDPAQGPRELCRDVAALDLRRLLSQLSHPAREVRFEDPARPRRTRLEADLRRPLRTRSRAVLRNRLAVQLLAHRSDGR